ncbi:hypothetical protein WT19_06410 [Burkholderia stagnalis]|nr:hypothetical protein WT17_15365 [Burkholderia stagnalis]KVO78215.1 hypothetical protein WT19_06410 [Burkholderia stagnalis]KVW64350.1 hypothetical protein WT28_11950 [Burkholderia stagnalis]KVX73085.1 hypothetical protein WT34_18480 [Burkholderia stagnalis]
MAGGSGPAPKGRPAMRGNGGVARGFSLKSGGLRDFIRWMRAAILKSNPYVDLSVWKKCPIFFIFYGFGNGLLRDEFGLALT